MKKLLGAGLFIAVFVVVAALWRQPLLTLLLTAVISLAMNVITGWRYIRSYLICAVLGPLAEVVCVHFGAWSYAKPQFSGIPIWLPLVWGMAGVFFVDIAEAIGEKQSKKRRR